MDASEVLGTDAGSWALWQPESFTNVLDYDSWSRELEEDADLHRHVQSGVVVPITIGEDGAYRFDVRVARTAGRLRRAAPAELSDRERAYLAASSDPYLFVSRGTACLGGIETVGPTDGSPAGRLTLDVPAGRWVVAVHLIAWDDEPGSKDERGRPVPTSLPDFLITLNPETDEPPRYRQLTTTFG